MGEGQPSAGTGPSSAVEQTLAALRQLFAGIRAGQPAWLEFDLTVRQIRALFALACHGPMTIGQVADTLHVRLPWASTVVDRLVDLHLVQRGEDPMDRRRTLARLTPRGEALVALVQGGHEERLRAALRELPPDDLTALTRGLEALTTALASEGRARESRDD
ncbi:MAG: MarR family winged helix-turn-helix transcriptional regulator [Chloroflexota bacterium]